MLTIFRFFFWWILMPCLHLCYLCFPKILFRLFWFLCGLGASTTLPHPKACLCVLHPKQLRTCTILIPKDARTLKNLNNFAIYFSKYSFVVVFKCLIAAVWVTFINFSRTFLLNMFQEKFFKFCGYERMVINCLPSSQTSSFFINSLPTAVL